MPVFNFLNTDLHSSMVRLETDYWMSRQSKLRTFTFQYGQIRNSCFYHFFSFYDIIYIPVWLDQKRKTVVMHKSPKNHLHSSMVRLETEKGRNIAKNVKKFTFQYGQIRNIYLEKQKRHQSCIYIPVWLDQKPSVIVLVKLIQKNLHSSMVRLETTSPCLYLTFKLLFTFQYGQIRNWCQSLRWCQSLKIYIPVWLDQKQIPAEYKNIITEKFTFQYGQIRNFQKRFR